MDPEVKVSPQAHARPVRLLRDLLGSLATPLLDRGTTGAALRLWGLAGLFVLYWLILSLVAKFPRVMPESWLSVLPFPANVFVDVGLSFFAPQVLVHLIPVAAALWLGLRLGSHYLDDLFELQSLRIAQRYLSSSVFGLNFDTLRVDTGDVGQLDSESPLFRIGGPGYLKVHLGFAAVLEGMDGSPRVYGPPGDGGGERVFIQGFERLRDVVDLRDQMRRVDEVRAVTLDGVEIHARDAQMVFRVLSGGKPRSLRTPYPYDDLAIRKLIYGQRVSARGPQKWTDALPGLVAQEIQSFVGGLTIEDFLALQPEALMGETADAGEAPPQRQAVDTFQIPRRELTRRFHRPEVKQRLEELGLELVWVGVGTWVLHDAPPSEYGVGPGRTLITAWRDLLRARRYRSADFYERQRKQRASDALADGIMELIKAWRFGEMPQENRVWEALARLDTLLLQLRQRVKGFPDLDLPLRFDDAASYIQSLIKPEVLGEGDTWT